MSVIISIVPIILGSIAASAAAGTAVAAIDNDFNNQSSIELPTNIRNEKILRETLLKMGAQNILSDSNSIGSDIDHFHIAFVQKEDLTYNIRFVGDVKKEDAINFRDELIAEYGNLVQSHVYETLKRKAEEKRLKLEKEVLQADQTIVLTYRVN